MIYSYDVRNSYKYTSRLSRHRCCGGIGRGEKVTEGRGSFVSKMRCFSPRNANHVLHGDTTYIYFELVETEDCEGFSSSPLPHPPLPVRLLFPMTKEPK